MSDNSADIIETFKPSFVSDKETGSHSNVQSSAAPNTKHLNALQAVEELRKARNVDDISAIYHEGVSEIRSALTPIQQRHSKKGVHGSILGDVVSFGRRFDPASVSKTGNVFQLVWAGVSNQVDYLRKKTAPIQERFNVMDRQTLEAINDAMSAVELSEQLRGIHQAALIALSEVLSAQRNQKNERGQELLQKREELKEQEDQSSAYYDLLHQCQALEEDILTLDRAVSTTESRIFSIECDVDNLRLLQNGFVQQVTSLKEARELIAEMRHKVEVIGLANGAKDRAMLHKGIMETRERLEILAGKQSHSAILLMAEEAERTLFSEKGLKTIIDGREKTAKRLQKTHEDGYNLRRKQNALINEGRMKHGIGSSVDAETRERIRAARRQAQINGSVNVTPIETASDKKRKKSKG